MLLNRDTHQETFKRNQGLLLRNARKSAKLTQKEVAFQFGLSQDTISKYERGEYSVDSYRLLEFSKLYSKPVTFFFMSERLK
jgi:transcriptional regulator with XRE-family HTH domain